MPLKFGSQVVTSVTCARTCLKVTTSDGRIVEGWGETPLAVAWVWPSSVDYDLRHEAILEFTQLLAEEIRKFDFTGHAFEIGNAFIRKRLFVLQEQFNAGKEEDAKLPHLAALVCFSLFDIAIHDAYGEANEIPVYQTYNGDYMNQDLSHFLTPAEGADVSFKGKYPQDFLVTPPTQLPVWHLVGGLDPLDDPDLTGSEPKDGYPVMLREWIRQDGLKCLKIKLRGTDAPWDYERLVRIGQMAGEEGVIWLTADFNCTVTDPAYVNEILDRLKDEHPMIYQAILYVEQPFPYDLEANPIDVRSLSARKPLFMDESAHDWEFVRMGRGLGWSGVALKTCKTQTGALLSLCWAKAHGMTLMVQDLTNPMMAQIPHVLLAAHAGTIMGVESNGMQFYPAASLPDLKVHPGLYQRRGGVLDLSTLRGNGFGYRVKDVHRELPEPVVAFAG